MSPFQRSETSPASRTAVSGPSPSLPLNVPVLAGIAFFLVVGQLVEFSFFPAITRSESVYVLLSILCYSALLTAGAALAGGLASKAATGFIPAFVWTALLAASTLYLADDFSYSWLALHLNETVPLLIQNAATDFQVMHSKMLALAAALGGYLGFLAVGTLVIRRGTSRAALFAKQVSARLVVGTTAGLMLLTIAQQTFSQRVLGTTAYEAERQILWQASLWPGGHASPAGAIFSIESPAFRQVPDETAIRAALATLNPNSVRYPVNIFLFIVDSLREDAIAEDTAPNLFRLKQQALSPRAGVASSNVTHISWFSILHSVNPLYWSVEAHQTHSPGATTLRALTRCGYRINALACPSLEYFGFATSVFGDSPSLVNTAIDQQTWLRSAPGADEGEIDRLVMERLDSELETLSPGSRAFYLVLLDAPHHDYTWSSQYQPVHVPFMEKVPLLTTSITARNVEQLRNRYKNAVGSTDALLGEFLGKLAARGLMDSSIIVVTGDHGEEFLERGHLAHSSALDRFQTRVPILIYVPQSLRADAKRPTQVQLASHIDIFPTILDALGLPAQVQALLDGRSLLGGLSEPAAYCAWASSYSPSRVLLDSGDDKLLIEFEGIGKLGRTLYARRMLATKVLDRDFEDVSVDNSSADRIRLRWQPALDAILTQP